LRTMAAGFSHVAGNIRLNAFDRVLDPAGSRRRFVVRGFAGRWVPEHALASPRPVNLDSTEVPMPTPQILQDLVRLLVQLLPAMALLCLVLAGIALRLEGGSTFSIGGSFTKWILWCVIMRTLPQLFLWFSFFGLPIPPTAGAIGTDWLEGIRGDVSVFINS